MLLSPETDNVSVGTEAGDASRERDPPWNRMGRVSSSENSERPRDTQHWVVERGVESEKVSCFCSGDMKGQHVTFAVYPVTYCLPSGWVLKESPFLADRGSK